MGSFKKIPGFSKLNGKRNLVLSVAVYGTLAVTGAAMATEVVGWVSDDQPVSHSSTAGGAQCSRWIDMMSPRA